MKISTDELINTWRRTADANMAKWHKYRAWVEYWQQHWEKPEHFQFGLPSYYIYRQTRWELI